jgi:hypothetical protein
MKIEKVETPKRIKIFLSKPRIWFNRNLEEVCCLFRRLIKLAIWATKNGFGPQALRAYRTDYWLLQNLVESEILQFTLGIQITSICAHSGQELVKNVNAFWKLRSCKIQEITRETIWSTIKLMELSLQITKKSLRGQDYWILTRRSQFAQIQKLPAMMYTSEWRQEFWSGIPMASMLTIVFILSSCRKEIPNQSNKQRHQGPKLFVIIKS